MTGHTTTTTTHPPTNSTSAISQLLLTRFWPNFKRRFLGPSLTHPNCHGDICPGNICPVDICPYLEYLSCYWPNFDQTLGWQVKAKFKVRSRKGQGKVKAGWRQGQGKVKARSRQGKVKARLRKDQCKVKAKSRQGQSQVKERERLRQHKQSLNHNYNIMGFDTIEINLVITT